MTCVNSRGNVSTASIIARCRLGIVDDHALLLDGLATFLRAHAADVDVVIAATGWFDLIRHPDFAPDVVVMDLQLQEQVSIETRVRTCLAAGAAVVVVSALETDEIRRRSLAAGAVSFVPKSSPAGAVLDAVRQAFANRAVSGGPEHAELETLRLYANGLSPVDIGLELGLPFETVKSHLAHLRGRYATGGRPSLSKQDFLRRAAEDGLVP